MFLPRRLLFFFPVMDAFTLKRSLSCSQFPLREKRKDKGVRAQASVYTMWAKQPAYTMWIKVPVYSMWTKVHVYTMWTNGAQAEL